MLDEMLLGVIVLNIAIAITCFLGAWRLACIRQRVHQWTLSLDAIETELHDALAQIPVEIQQNRQQWRDRRQRYNQLQLRLGQYLKWTQQTLAIVQWGTARWQGSGNLSPRTSYGFRFKGKQNQR